MSNYIWWLFSDAAHREAARRVQEAEAAASRAAETATQLRTRAQLLMSNADLAAYKAAMALRVAEAIWVSSPSSLTESPGLDSSILLDWMSETNSFFVYRIIGENWYFILFDQNTTRRIHWYISFSCVYSQLVILGRVLTVFMTGKGLFFIKKPILRWEFQKNCNFVKKKINIGVGRFLFCIII